MEGHAKNGNSNDLKFPVLIKALNEDESGNYINQLIKLGLSEKLVNLIKGLPLSTRAIKSLSLGCDSFSILLDKIKEISGVSPKQSLRQLLKHRWTPAEYNALDQALEDCGVSGTRDNFARLIKKLNEDKSGDYRDKLIELGLSEYLVGLMKQLPLSARSLKNLGLDCDSLSVLVDKIREISGVSPEQSLRQILDHSWTSAEYNALVQALKDCGGSDTRENFARLIKKLNEDKSGDYRDKLIELGLSEKLVGLMKQLPTSDTSLKNLDCDSFSALIKTINPSKVNYQSSVNSLLDFLREPEQEAFFQIKQTELIPIFFVLIEKQFPDLELHQKQVHSLISSLKEGLLTQLLNSEISEQEKIKLLQDILKNTNGSNNDELPTLKAYELAKAFRQEKQIPTTNESPENILQKAQSTYSLGQSIANLPETVKYAAINELWQALMNVEQGGRNNFIKNISELPLEDFGKEIRAEFMKQLKKVGNLRQQYKTNKEQLAYKADLKFKPNFMQFLTAARLLEEPYLLNACGTGLGKTDAGILAMQATNRKMSLVICNNATVGQWIENIREKLDPDKVAVIAYSPGKDPDSSLDERQQTKDFLQLQKSIQSAQEAGKQIYLVINYDKFSRNNDLVTNLSNLPIDGVIGDEVHYVKAGEDSSRGENVQNLLDHLRSKNKDLKALFLTATPVSQSPEDIGNILRILTGNENSVSERKTIGNILAARQEALPSIIRLSSNKHKQNIIERTGWKEPSLAVDYSISDNPITEDKRQLLINKLREAKTPADVSIALIQEKANIIATECLPSLEPSSSKTIIYTHFLKKDQDGFSSIDNLKQALKNQGFKDNQIAICTGEANESQKFIHDPNIRVMIMSSAGGTGIDGLQAVCNRIICATNLGYTPLQEEQILGRVRNRQGSPFSDFEMIIPTVKIQLDNGEYLSDYDLMCWNLIDTRKTVSRAVLEGDEIPTDFAPSEESLLNRIQKQLEVYSTDSLGTILQEIYSTNPPPQTSVKPIESKKSENTKENNYPSFKTLTTQMHASTGEKMHEYLQTPEGEEAWKAYHDDLDKLYAGRLKPMDFIITHYLMTKAQTIFGNNKSVTVLNLGCGRDLLVNRLDSSATPQMNGNLRNWLHQAKRIEQITTIDLDHVSESDNVIASDISTMTDTNSVKKDSTDLTIFSLSLRGKDTDNYLIQAFMALKNKGKLLIADHKNVFKSNERADLQTKLQDLGFANISINEIGDYFFILATADKK